MFAQLCVLTALHMPLSARIPSLRTEFQQWWVSRALCACGSPHLCRQDCCGRVCFCYGLEVIPSLHSVSVLLFVCDKLNLVLNVCRDKQRIIYTSPLKALSNQVPREAIPWHSSP